MNAVWLGCILDIFNFFSMRRCKICSIISLIAIGLNSPGVSLGISCILASNSSGIRQIVLSGAFTNSSNSFFKLLIKFLVDQNYFNRDGDKPLIPGAVPVLRSLIAPTISSSLNVITFFAVL